MGLRKAKRSTEELYPSRDTLKKESAKLMKKLCKKYPKEDIRAAIAIIAERTVKETESLKAGKRIENLHDWTQVGDDIERIIKELHSGETKPLPARPIDDISDDIDWELGILEEEIILKDKEAEIEEARKLTKKALELEKPVDRAQLEETLKDELDGIKEMQARRPAALMRDGELADSLYELNQISHLYFQAQEMHTLFMDIAEIGGDMGLTEAQAKELAELQSKVTDRLAEIYDVKTTWLITGKEE